MWSECVYWKSLPTFVLQTKYVHVYVKCSLRWQYVKTLFAIYETNVHTHTSLSYILWWGVERIGVLELFIQLCNIVGLGLYKSRVMFNENLVTRSTTGHIHEWVSKLAVSEFPFVLSLIMFVVLILFVLLLMLSLSLPDNPDMTQHAVFCWKHPHTQVTSNCLQSTGRWIESRATEMQPETLSWSCARQWTGWWWEYIGVL